jgi:hypothetical protein
MKNYKSSDIEELLHYRYAGDAYAFLPQVRNGTGFTRVTRTADIIVMGLWPSRGLCLDGFEIKVNRGDWLSELRNPVKAEEIAKFCDHWWLVAPKEIVNIDEVPDKWGYMIPFGKTVKVVKQATHLEPTPIDRLFLAAILRKASQTICPDVKLKEQFTLGQKNGQQYCNSQLEQLQYKNEELQRTIFEFEKTSGIKLNEYWPESNGKIGEAVKMVLDGSYKREKENLQRLLNMSQDISKRIEEALNKKD